MCFLTGNGVVEVVVVVRDGRRVKADDDMMIRLGEMTLMINSINMNIFKKDDSMTQRFFMINISTDEDDNEERNSGVDDCFNLN